MCGAGSPAMPVMINEDIHAVCEQNYNTAPWCAQRRAACHHTDLNQYRTHSAGGMGRSRSVSVVFNATRCQQALAPPMPLCAGSPSALAPLVYAWQSSAGMGPRSSPTAWSLCKGQTTPQPSPYRCGEPWWPAPRAQWCQPTWHHPAAQSLWSTSRWDPTCMHARTHQGHCLSWIMADHAACAEWDPALQALCDIRLRCMSPPCLGPLHAWEHTCMHSLHAALRVSVEAASPIMASLMLFDIDEANKSLPSSTHPSVCWPLPAGPCEALPCDAGSIQVTLRHPLELFTGKAVHGGGWRAGYLGDTAGELAGQ